jgi:hypothetical protein
MTNIQITKTLVPIPLKERNGEAIIISDIEILLIGYRYLECGDCQITP